MNDKNYARIAYHLVILLLVSILGTCQKTATPKPPSSEGDFKIHLISLSRIVDAVQADEELDILNNPQYIISDTQIESYAWSQQLITFDDSIQDIYVNDVNFLSWPSNFAIIWRGEIVAKGQILDTVSPVRTTHPVIYVLEPKGDPLFPSSAHRTIGTTISDPDSIEYLSILLRADNQQLFEIEEKTTDIFFDSQIAKEIKKYFQQNGKLID